MLKNFFDNKIVKKPWGSEYVIYKDNNHRSNVAITYLNINYNHQTSLHCHTRKKTGFIILNGNAKVQYGIYKINKKFMKPINRFIFRPGLFHSIKSISKKGLKLLEFETPYDKGDLVRLEDKYGRKAKRYEGKKFTENLKSKNVVFKKPEKKKKNKYFLDNVEIIIENIKSLNKPTTKDDKISVAILSGCLIDKKGLEVLSCGDLLKLSTLKILHKNFKIKKNLTIMKVIKH